MWPAATVIAASLVLLSVWTATGDYGWVRSEIDSLTGESIGRCKGDTTIYFMIPVMLLNFVPCILTCIMAYKTQDVDDLYRWALCSSRRLGSF